MYFRGKVLVLLRVTGDLAEMDEDDEKGLKRANYKVEFIWKSAMQQWNEWKSASFWPDLLHAYREWRSATVDT